MRLLTISTALMSIALSCIPCRVVDLEMEPFDMAVVTQTRGDELNEDFVAYDSPPVLVGGYASIREKIASHYPDSARRKCLHATVHVTALVSENGSVDTVISHQNDQGWGFNDAAIAIVRQTKWRPAKRQGVPVKVKVTMPIVFRL